MLEEILAVLYRPITDRLEVIMTELADAKLKMDALTAAFASMKTRIAGDVANLQSLIETLRAEVAAGTVDQATVDAIAAQADALKATADSIDPDPSFPAPAPPAPTP